MVGGLASQGKPDGVSFGRPRLKGDYGKRPAGRHLACIHGEQLEVAARADLRWAATTMEPVRAHQAVATDASAISSQRTPTAVGIHRPGP